MRNESNCYFGTHWNGFVATNHEQAPTPVDQSCYWCKENIVEGDQGFIIPSGQTILDEKKDGVFDKMVATFLAVHLDCFLRQVIGSVGHLSKKCSCFGGEMEDPPEMTKREAARAAVKLFRRNND